MRRPWLCTSLFTASNDSPYSCNQFPGYPSILSVSLPKHRVQYNVCWLVYDAADLSTQLTSSTVSVLQASSPIRASLSISISIKTNVLRFKVQSSPTEPPCSCRIVVALAYFFCLLIFWDRYDCNGVQGQRWTINRGSTKVQVAGTNFCLDGDACQWSDNQLCLLFYTDDVLYRSGRWHTS